MAEKIDSTHSKKELCEIVEIFDLKVVDYKNLNKTELSKSILYNLSIIDEINEDNDYYFLKDKNELIEYLIHPDASKELTIKEKNGVMELAKYIIIYCKNNYYLSCSPFIDWDDMLDKIKYIANYGDIPSVRKAIDAFNKDPKMLDRKPIEYIMSTRCRKKIERKNRMVQKEKVCLKIRRGRFLVSFD